MQTCCPHAEDDPDPERPRPAPPDDQIPRGRARHDAVRLPARGDRTHGGAPDAGGDAGPAPLANAGQAERVRRRDHPRRTGRMIVVDASAVTELLLQTPSG